MNYPCDVELITEHRRCGGVPARAFTASCACGHQISGHMCEACSLSTAPGCLPCWNDGKGHKCAAQFSRAIPPLTGVA